MKHLETILLVAILVIMVIFLIMSRRPQVIEIRKDPGVETTFKFPDGFFTAENRKRMEQFRGL